MARYGKSHIAGKAVEGRSGWRMRRDRARQKRRRSREERDQIAAMRRTVAGVEAETGFNPGVSPSGDYVGSLSDGDLIALYRQLHDGRAPSPKARRAAVERAVRAKHASAPAAVDTPTLVDEGDV